MHHLKVQQLGSQLSHVLTVILKNLTTGHIGSLISE